MMKFQPNLALDLTLADQALFAAWLQGQLPSKLVSLSAREELQVCLDDSADRVSRGPSPFFAATRNSEFGPTWAATMLSDLPDARSREVFETNLDMLQSGQAGVVVTGQQPGSMGGPLYTLFKAATMVSLARERTRAGRPTVPVFWSGDDDDDLAEGLKPRTWDPVSDQIFGNPISLAAYADGTRQRPCLGNLRASRWSYPASQWLNSDPLQAMLPVLGQDLALLWAEACAEEWSWAKLNRRFLLRVFRGRGLIVVSGNDPFLHQSARPLYDELLSQRQELATTVRLRGEDLAQQGYPVPINNRSLHRNLFYADGPGRRFLEDGQNLSDPSRLRPGVMLRSPIQDWLFEPEAVVVGPGELAYLRQLDPIYSQLGLARCPLVPRLFGWVVPQGFALSALDPHAKYEARPAAQIGDLADSAALVAEMEVRRILLDELGVAPDRAGSLAAGRSRRWRKSLEAMFRNESKRRLNSVDPGLPAWVFPEGGRQERILSSLTVAALWGDPFVEAMLSGASTHLEQGLNDGWKEFVVQVPDPRGDRS